VRKGALWGLAQRALQEAEQGELNSEGLGRIRVLVAEGARGPHPARQLPSRPPLRRAGLSRFRWPLAFRVGPFAATSDCLAAWLLGLGLGLGLLFPLSAFLPPPLLLPLPRVSAPRLPCPLLPLTIPKLCPKLNLK